MKNSALFLSVVFLSLPATERRVLEDRIYLWRSPRGQVITWARSRECLHFSFAGGLQRWRDLVRVCGHRSHHLYLSRWRSEDQVWIRRLHQEAVLCLSEPNPSSWHRLYRPHDFAEGVPPCPEHPEVEIWRPRYFGTNKKIMTRAEKNKQKAASYFLSRLGLLLLGDSPEDEQRRAWVESKRAKLVIRNHRWQGSQRFYTRDWGDTAMSLPRDP